MLYKKRFSVYRLFTLLFSLLTTLSTAMLSPLVVASVSSQTEPSLSGEKGEGEQTTKAKKINSAKRSAIISPLAQEGMLIDMTVSEGRIIVVGERGHILYSDNSGESWEQAAVPTQNLLTGVTFVGKRGWAAGHDGLILYSDNHGASWSVQRFAPYRALSASEPDDGRAGAPLLDILFLDEKRGFAVGAYGYFLGTKDGGIIWQDLSESIDNIDGFHLNNINRSPQGDLFIVGEMGSLFRSLNGGTSWQRVAAPYEGSLFGSELSLAPERIYCYGLAGRLFESFDLGESWHTVTLLKPDGRHFSSSNTAAVNGTIKNTIMASAPNGSNDPTANTPSLIFAGNGGLIFTYNPLNGVMAVRHREDRQSLMGVTATQSGLVLIGKSGVARDDS